MRFIRLLGAVVVFYGLSYLFYGQLQLFALMRQPTSNSLTRYIIMLNMTIGLITFIIGIGLLMVKTWARIGWLAVSAVLLVEHLLILLFFYLIDANLVQQVINVFLISMLVIISWPKLNDAQIKQYFT